jgi:prevent-host-death family protein
MTTTIGSFEAKTHFANLLERVEHGEEILITRRRKQVARLVPAHTGHDAAAARAAADRRQVLAQAMKPGSFDWNKWKGYRDERRR